MKGTWFSLHNGQIYLCTLRRVDELDEVKFTHLLNGFIIQVQACEEKIAALTEEAYSDTPQASSEQWAKFV